LRTVRWNRLFHQRPDHLQHLRVVEVASFLDALVHDGGLQHPHADRHTGSLAFMASVMPAFTRLFNVLAIVGLSPSVWFIRVAMVMCQFSVSS
jgi:hypothetical protein